MGEIKSVKVDNWGVFFLQKLQNFFNKTDYCDLTLQFRDNSQLKVHRLVLSACTDYFNVLEQTCEMIDDALIMPNELQADVVVPIVNFMYTGTLEFELKMYGKLLRTAKEMNMTVLLKLLEAHRRTMENVNRQQRPPSPKTIRRRLPTTPGALTSYQNQGQQPVRRVLTTTGTGNANTIQRRVVQTKSAGTNPIQIQYRQQIGSTSVVRTSALRGNQTQQSIQSYIKHEPDEFQTITTQQQPTSPFEQLRKGYNNNKRPAVSTFLSPPSKKPNLEDVKEFAEQQRMRKQIAAEFGDDQEFEGMMDDDIHNDDDDDEVGTPAQSSTMNASKFSPSTSSQSRQDSNSGSMATITFKHDGEGKPPTVIVKDSSGSKMDHAKIISEVLRQYPHLTKGNKNIKLKIMPTGAGQAQRIIIKKESDQGDTSQTQQQNVRQQSQKVNQPLRTTPTQLGAKQAQQISTVKTPIALQKTATTTQATTTTAATSGATTAETTQQKRRIDSKTMHALIAQGAENMTGPWLCLRCGVNGRPISIPSYRGFRRHLINTHKEAIDPALCEHCGWRSQNNRELHFHVQIEHKIRTTLYTFPECLLCAELFLDTNTLNQHMIDSHPSANKQQCVYCNKIFIKEMQLFTHLKLYHKHQAVEDGIIDASDDEYGGSQGTENENENDNDNDDGMEEHLDSEDYDSKDKKVKILSDISLPMAPTTATTITSDATSIDAHTKFVTPDGNEMILTEEQRKEIISQLNQDHNNGGVVMVLNDSIFAAADNANAANTSAVSAQSMDDEENAATNENDENAENAASEEEVDDSQIYAEFENENKSKVEKSQEDCKDLENLEWAENIVTEQEMADNETVPAKKTEEENAKKELISKKLKELTVDWSEDENEDDEDLDKSAETEEDEQELEVVKKSEKSQHDESSNKLVEEKERNAKTAAKKREADDEEKEKSDENIHKDLQESELKEKEVVDEEQEEEEKAIENKDEKIEEHDELELAMQSLHQEDESVVDAKSTKEADKTAITGITEIEKMDVDESLKEELPVKEKDAELSKKISEENENQESNLGATLLDELISTAEENTEEELSIEKPTESEETLKKISSTEVVEKEKEKVDDVLEEVKDEEEEEEEEDEEFIKIEKEKAVEEVPAAPIGDASKSIEKSETLKEVASSNSSDDASAKLKQKSLSSDWEDIDDDGIEDVA